MSVRCVVGMVEGVAEDLRIGKTIQRQKDREDAKSENIVARVRHG